MNENFESFILDKTGATKLGSKETIQELWSGYGKILRVGLKGAPIKSVIVKTYSIVWFYNTSTRLEYGYWTSTKIKIVSN